MQYYLARWEWADQGGFFAWQPPQNAIACLDFRSIPQMSLAGGSPEGFGFFAYLNPVVLPGSIDLGNNLNGIINNAKKNALKTSLSLLSNITVNSLLEILFELLTIHSDPTGLVRWKPLMPTRANNLEIHLQGHSKIISKKLIPGFSSEWNNVKAVLQEDYRKIRQQGLDGFHDKDLHRKFLQALVEKFKIDFRDLIPADLPEETPLPHQTTITESFNKADSTVLGPDLTWDEFQTGGADPFEVFSNTCRYAASQTLNAHTKAKAETDLATDDHYAQITLINVINGNPTYSAVIIRKDSTTTVTCYHFDMVDDAGADRFRSWKIEGAVFTALGSTNQTPIANDILRGEMDGNSLKLKVNGIILHTITDTAITGKLRCGIGFYSNVAGTRPQIDNFEAGDLQDIFFKRKDKTLIGM